MAFEIDLLHNRYSCFISVPSLPLAKVFRHSKTSAPWLGTSQRDYCIS